MTRPLAAVERLLERLFERPAARLFNTAIQPIQIQRKLERAMDTGRVFSGDHAYVPTRYRVRLNPQDARGFEGYLQTVEAELADALHARARSRGFRLLARPTVAIEASARIQVADIDVISEVVDRRALENGHGHEDAQRLRGPHGTGMFEVERVRSSPPVIAPPVGSFASPEQVPESASVTSVPSVPLAVPPTQPVSPPTEAPPMARVEVRTRGAFIAGCEFRGGTAPIGRANDNQIVLVDDRVSRHHAQLSSRQGTLVFTDLGSTNGSFVNGTRVREIVLGSGDVVRLGNSTLTIHPHA